MPTVGQTNGAWGSAVADGAGVTADTGVGKAVGRPIGVGAGWPGVGLAVIAVAGRAVPWSALPTA